MQSRRCLFVVAVWASLIVTAQAHVWIVPDDFATPQAAIVGAAEGDVILVRPGTYPTFTLDKGVIVRAQDSSFSIDGPHKDSRVVVTGIAQGQKAGISGMMLASGWNSGPRLLVSGCAGEVVLESVTIAPPNNYYDNIDNTHLKIVNCSDVIVTNLLNNSFGIADQTPDAVVLIQSSSVRLADVSVRGLDNVAGRNGLDGGAAISVETSFVVLARTDVVGGKGGDSIYCDPNGFPTIGGDGGAGIRVSDSDLIVMGSETDGITGGRGGDGESFCSSSKGGHGGDGIHQSGSGLVTASRLILAGGKGGASLFGGGAGLDGNPSIGNMVRDDRFPFLDVDANLHPGQTFQIAVDAVTSGSVLLLFAGHGGFAGVPGGIGPPLSVLPVEWFLVFQVGSITPPAELQLTITLPSDDVIRGVSINSQAIVLGVGGKIFLSNAVVRVVGG